MSQPLPDNLIRSEEEVSPAELCPSRPQPTSQTGPLYNLNHGDKKGCKWCSRIKLVYRFSRTTSKTHINCVFVGDKEQKNRKKTKEMVCVRAHTCNNMMQTG